MKELQNVKPVRVTPITDPVKDDGKWGGINKPIRAITEDGREVVFKHNSLGVISKLGGKKENEKERDIKEVIASHIMEKYFNLPTVTYYEGYYINKNAERVEGVFSDLRKDILEEFNDGATKKVKGRTLENTPVSEIKIPDVAVAQSIVKGWMGDWDITVNDSNVWVAKDGTPLAADFGFSLNNGIISTFLRVPNANIKVMKVFAKKENVEPVVEKIRKLSDDEIKDMVHWANVTYINNSSMKTEKELASILINNRDILRKTNPFAKYYNGPLNFIQPLIHEISFPIVLFANAGKALCSIKAGNIDKVMVDALRTYSIMLSIMIGFQKTTKIFNKISNIVERYLAHNPDFLNIKKLQNNAIN